MFGLLPLLSVLHLSQKVSGVYIASALSAPITYFYEGIGQEGPRQITLHQRMQLEIARNFAEIRNEKHQEAVSQLARVLTSR